MTASQSEENFLRRGLILLALHAQFPMPLTRTSMERQVGPFYSIEPRAFEYDIALLERKGYLIVRSAEVGDRALRTYELTAPGADLVDGATSDPGVRFARG